MPSSISLRPSSISRVVVLPAPLGPSIPKISPELIDKETPSTALKILDLFSGFLYFLMRLDALIIAIGALFHLIIGLSNNKLCISSVIKGANGCIITNISFSIGLRLSVSPDFLHSSIYTSQNLPQKNS